MTDRRGILPDLPATATAKKQSAFARALSPVHASAISFPQLRRFLTASEDHVVERCGRCDVHSGVRQFDAVRLDRDAASAGQAFGFEDIDASGPQYSRASMWMMRAGCLAVFACCLLYTLG
jgi:hypothetical protein